MGKHEKKTDEAQKTGDYDVGYKKPPKRNQFKPGESGNPGIGSAPQTTKAWIKKFADYSELTAHIEMRKDNEKPKVIDFSIKNGHGPIRALVAIQLIKGAIEGDLSFIREFLDRTDGKAKQEAEITQKGNRRVSLDEFGNTVITWDSGESDD